MFFYNPVGRYWILEQLKLASHNTFGELHLQSSIFITVGFPLKEQTFLLIFIIRMIILMKRGRDQDNILVEFSTNNVYSKSNLYSPVFESLNIKIVLARKDFGHSQPILSVGSLRKL